MMMRRMVLESSTIKKRNADIPGQICS